VRAISRRCDLVHHRDRRQRSELRIAVTRIDWQVSLDFLQSVRERLQSFRLTVVAQTKVGLVRCLVAEEFVIISSDLAKVRTMVSRPTGTIMAPPQPCSTRHATSKWMLLDMPQKNDPKVNSPIADPNTRRVPNRSAIQPLIGMKTARLKV
jgi:hypothetical protein